MIRKKIATLLAALIVFSNVLLPVTVYAADQNDFEVNPFAQADLFRRQRQSGMLANRDAYNGQTDRELKTAEAKASAGEKKKAIAAGQSYLVQFNGGSSLQAIENVLQGEDYQLIGSSENRLFQLTTSDIGAFRKKAAGLLEYLEKDQSRQAKQVANDYFYDEQWALPMVNAPAAWDISTGSSGADTVYVAVIDSGVDRSHPDLDNANIQSGWDYIGASACVGDYFGHGTSVTGIIAAETNNGEGMAGVCWNVAIVPLQIVDRSGYIALSDMIAAIYDAVDAGCKVINLSMGGGYSAAEEEAIQYAIGSGCIVVASAGNSYDSTYSYPASYAHVVSVGSVDSLGNWSAFSTYNDQVDVCAPGEAVLSTYYSDADPDADYALVSGTSFSAPYVSGIAALAAGIDPDLTADRFLELLSGTCEDKGAIGRDPQYGYGLIKADKILSLLAGWDNAKLSSLTVSAGSLSPAFSADRTAYSLRLPSGSTSFVVSAVQEIANAKVYIDSVLQNQATISMPVEGTGRRVSITVAAQDQLTRKEYSIEAYRPFSTYSLTVNNPQLRFDGQEISGFAGSQTGQMTLDLTLSNNAAFEVYGRPDGTEPIGNTLNLSFGANYYYLKVIADDPAISRLFPITIWRGESDALPAAPVIALQDQGTGQPVENGGTVRNPVKATVISNNSFTAAVVFNGAPAIWPADGIFSQAGLYQISVAETDGQTVSASFTIDQTAPEIKATANGALLAQNAHTRYSVLLSVTDANLAAKTLKKNNVDIAWPENNFINSDGNYTVIATDKAGNTANFLLTIDKTPPTVAAKTSTGVALANGAISKYSVTLLASDRNLKAGILKKNNVTIAWPSDNIINSDGVYTIAAVDCAGNTSAALSLTIDKTKPTITAKTSAGTVLANGAYSKYNVTLLVSDRNFKTKTLKKNNVTIAWPRYNVLSSEGVYTVTATDKAGNVAVFTLTIDKTRPRIRAKTSSGYYLGYGAYTRYNVIVSVSDKNYRAKSVKRNGVAIAWPRYNTFTSNGTYVISAWDKAGNLTTFKFTIRR